MSEEFISSFAWRDKISSFQKAFLKVSQVLGIIMFIVGIQMATKGSQTFGNAISGLGMFMAVQMFWGIKSFFNYLEQKKSKYLKMGYHKLFWIAIFVAYIMDMIGLGLIFTFLGS